MTHIPVLLQEVLEVLNPKPGDFVIDGTLGSGGHAREILKRIMPNGIFLGVDRDPNAVAAFGQEMPEVKILTRQQSYAALPDILKELQLPKADGLLLDLGFSSDQLSHGAFQGRGFSFQSDESLIMTYDDATAPLKEQLKTLSVAELTRILSEFGEERFAPRIAEAISERVRRHEMETTGDLVAAVLTAVPARYEHGRIHPATRTFQALRIYANRELEQLEEVLKALPEVVKEGGVVAIISFHSLEDRVVKQYFRQYAKGLDEHVRGQRYSADQSGELPNTGVHTSTVLTKKPITALSEEVKRNPRSRSAKLRALRL